MSYLTLREYVRSWVVCLGALLVIGGSILAIMAQMGNDIIPGYTLMIGAVVAVLGLIILICGFFWTRKKRDSVLAPIDTRVEDAPPPPPPPD